MREVKVGNENTPRGVICLKSVAVSMSGGRFQERTPADNFQFYQKRASLGPRSSWSA